MRVRSQWAAPLVAVWCLAAQPRASAEAQPIAPPDAPRTAAYAARGDLISAELTNLDPGRRVATTVTVNAYSGLAFPGETIDPTPRRLVVVIDRRQTTTGAPILFAVGTATSFELGAENPASATLRAVVPMYALDGERLFEVAIDLGWTAAKRPRAVHWVNPFNVPGFSSVFHALDVASEASVEGRVAVGDANFCPERGQGVLALGARVIVGIVPRLEPSVARAASSRSAPAEAMQAAAALTAPSPGHPPIPEPPLDFGAVPSRAPLPAPPRASSTHGGTRRLETVVTPPSAITPPSSYGP